MTNPVVPFRALAQALPSTASRRSGLLWAALGVALGLGTPGAQAQTLIDTLQTTNVINTLQQSTTSSGAAALDRARQLQQNLQLQNAQNQAALSAASVATPPPAPAFSAAQAQQLSNARALLSQGNPRGAQASYEALIAENYQQPEPHFGLGLALFSLGDLAGARFEFAQFAALSPTSFEGPYNLGVVATRLGQYDEALKQFTAALGLAQNATPAARRQLLEALAGEQARRQDYAALSATLTQAYAIDSSDLGLAYRLGQATALSGNGAGALPLLYAALQSSADRVNAALLIADIYRGQNLPQRAVRELDAVAGNSQLSGSERAQLLVRKSQLLGAQGQLKAALQAAREAVSADSRSSLAYAALASALGAQAAPGQGAAQVTAIQKSAWAAWQSAAQYDPKNPAYQLGLATTQLELGQNAAARLSAQQALKLSSDNAQKARAAFVTGVAAYRLKDYGAAQSALKSSAALHPDASTSLWLGLSSYARQDYVGAITALNDSVRLKDSAETRFNLGAAYLGAGRFAEAESALRAVVVAQPSNAAAWYQLGLSRKAQGKDDSAQSAFRSAAQLGSAQAKAELN